MAAALLIAAPASGQGKTTAAAALARLHTRQGRRVRCFKCGPDFLDPLWLQAASGYPVDSLDLWINGADDCARRLASASLEADLIVVEGVMGLFDGDPSAADLARRFAIPVVAVIDAGAMAGSFAAVAHGLRNWLPDLPWAGVLANGVGSPQHADILMDALEPERRDDGGPWLGHLSRSEAIGLPERHPGLAMPGESSRAQARLDAAADALSTTPLGRRALPGTRRHAHELAAWPVWQAPVAPPPAPALQFLAGRRIAVAHDAAFAFVYPANLQVLRELGAQPVFFSPLAGDALPACDAIWLPGGYPELHAARLAQCFGLRAQIAAHVDAGKPLWAECGGLMVLAERLVDGAARSHPMWGLLPGAAVMERGLASLGPHELSIGDGIEPLRGHSFHWSRLDTPLPPAAYSAPQLRPSAVGTGEPVFERGGLRGSCFHPWFASSPAATARLFDPAPLFGGSCRMAAR